MLTLEKRLWLVSKALKCHSMIGEKMLRMVSSSNISMAMTLKWRKKRGVTVLRPPPAVVSQTNLCYGKST